MKKISTCLTALVLGGLVSWTVGCGGGASTTPTVTARSAKKADGETKSDTTAESKSSDSGAPAKGGFGTFSGRVVLKGTAPETKLLVKKGDTTAKDAAVCAAEDVPDDSLLVGKDGGVANVFIYLAKAPAGGKKLEVPSEPFNFDQKFCRFKPHAMKIAVGQTVNVLNDDAVLHNTHTFPLANDSFNKAVQPNERKGIALVYDAPEKEPVQVKCDIHPFMLAWQFPVSHPYVAVTDEDGKFEIKDVPSGNHEFVIWHERPKYIERKYKVSISADSATEKELTFDASKFALVEDPNVKVVHISALGR